MPKNPAKAYLKSQHPENFYRSKSTAYLGGLATVVVFSWFLPKKVKHWFIETMSPW